MTLERDELAGQYQPQLHGRPPRGHVVRSCQGCGMDIQTPTKGSKNGTVLCGRCSAPDHDHRGSENTIWNNRHNPWDDEDIDDILEDENREAPY